MEKAKLLAALEQFKDRPFEIGVDGSSDFSIYGNIDGRWVFIADNFVVQVMKNVPNGRYNISNLSQNEKPFVIFKVNIDEIIYVKSYITLDTLAADLNDCTPVGTTKSKSDIIKELESDSINKSKSTVAPGSPFGAFRGSVISTTIDGVDPHFKNL